MNSINQEEAKKIAEEAYIYAFPMLMGYRFAFASFLMPGIPSHRGPANTLTGKAVTLDHTFKDVITPNADTPYSFVLLDLRAEPMVLQVPAITDRYYVFQFVDLFGTNPHFVGSRATGSDAGTYLLTHEPDLIERRLRWREKESQQRRIIAISLIPFLLAYLLPGLDHRFGWSDVPSAVVLGADALVLLGYLLIVLVFRENRYASRSVEVVEGQEVIVTGPYAVVRHPMYVGTLLMYLLSPVALGSYWAALFALPLLWVIRARIRNEEEVLLRDLPGYGAYMERVRYRLIPRLW